MVGSKGEKENKTKQKRKRHKLTVLYCPSTYICRGCRSKVMRLLQLSGPCNFVKNELNFLAGRNDVHS